MDKPNAFGTSRRIALFVVLALHFGLLALIVMASRTQHYGVSAEQALELLYLPAVRVPQVRADAFNYPRPKTDSAMAKTDIRTPLAPPLGSSSLMLGSSSTPGGGSAVNWAAEAHRAIKAFEIRRDQPQDPAQSVSATWDEWWPRQHHAGDQYKTESGDWIVWISADCYQIAVAHSNPSAVTTSSPQTVCPQKGVSPRGE
ncbi:MAG: hypothetical protein M3O26_14655 [Pseudomonadota bacterium]|nr:hypothetical protein [Pseudomonadota bacterium]